MDLIEGQFNDIENGNSQHAPWVNELRHVIVLVPLIISEFYGPEPVARADRLGVEGKGCLD